MLLRLILTANLGLFFLVELAAFAAFAVASFRLAPGAALSWVAAVLAFGAVVTLWALLFAPRSARRLRAPFRQIGEIAVFLLASLLLSLSGLEGWGLALALAALVTVGVAALSEQELRDPPSR